MSFPRYPKYKDSGVEWLGEVPEHWDVRRLRFVAELNPSKSEIADVDRATSVSFLPMEAIGDDGSLDLSRERPIGEVENGYTYFREGDVTCAKITPCFENGKGAVMRGLANGIGFGTTELIVARPRSEYTTSEYLHLVFTSAPFRTVGESHMYGAGGQKRVPDAFVRDTTIALPPIDEQRRIVCGLAREIVTLDRLRLEQERLVDLLAEKRQATISHAVTKGLNPDAPVKSSGIEWLGDVPAHWRSDRNRTFFFEVDDRSESDHGELLTVSHITGVTRRSEKDVNMFLAETLEGYKRCSPGDLVINTMWAWMGALGCSPLGGLVSPSYNVYRARPGTDVLPRYYDYLCRIPSHRVAMKSRSSGIWESRLRLYPDAFLSMGTALPPLDEQRAIVDALDRETRRYDALMSEAERAIALLHERRTALISAAVTGKIDVRGLTDTAA